jgi:UDP-N-acetylglucosamine 4-epimerase
MLGYEDITFKKVTNFLVTGAAGFIGSNLVEAILKLGYEVRGLDNYSTGKRDNINPFLENPLFEFIEGDIRDIEICKRACEDIDYVLHQAALGSVPRSIKYPLLYEEVNIKGTLNMMQAAVETGVKRFIYASSSSVYGDSEELPKVEGREGKVLSPYALTKVVNEELGRLYYNLYGLETIGLRYFNVFGRRQDPHSQYAAVIPIFVKALLNNESPTIFGDGEQSRDFTYIENVVEANLKACKATNQACGEAFNIAYGERITINVLYNKLSELLGKKIKPTYAPERQGDIKHSLADISKARELIKYNPKYDLNTGLKMTIKRYMDYM